jgi:hypothetical protein
MHHPTIGTGLSRDEYVAQHQRGDPFGLFRVVDHDDPARRRPVILTLELPLPTPPRVDLRLDHDATAELLGNRPRRFGRAGDLSPRNRDPVLAE